MEPAVTIPPEP
jgi:hypothetical protein